MARTIIRRREVLRRTGFSNTTQWRLERAGHFPARIQLTDAGSVGWYLDEVEQWIQQRIRGGGKTPPGRKGAVA